MSQKEKKEGATIKQESSPKDSETTVRPKKIELNRNDLIECKNTTDGQLVYISQKTGLQTIWMNYGDIEFIDLGELVTMKSSQPQFLKDVWITIDDESVIEYLGLKHIYKNLIDTENLDSFFNKTPDNMELALQKIPKGVKDSIATRARKLVEEGTLYDYRKIAILENNLKIGLKMFIK